MPKKKSYELDGDEELRLIHAAMGPRHRYNDPRFSEDLPDWMMEKSNE